MFLAFSAVLMLTGCQKEDTIDPTKFTVAFNTNGGSEVKAVIVEEGKKLTKPTDPTKGEFIFVGWFKEATWTTAWDFENDVVTKDITLYAKWTTVTYTITFNTNGGSAVAPLTVAKGSTAIKPLPPTKNDAAFDNWYKEVALANVYDFSTAVNADITLYAKWVTVTRETLQILVDDAQVVNSSNYTTDSYNAMRVKLEAAYQVLQSSNPTTQQIATAYTELSAAINALVALPNRAVVDVYISKVIDGVVYVNKGQSFNLYAYATDATGESATDRRVTFTYDVAQLATWAEGDIHTEETSLWFSTKSTLTAGAEVSVIIKSAENPAISKTITLKVAAEGEVKTMFINAVNALPAPDKIEYKHYDAINEAYDIYYSIPDQQDPAVQAAYTKLRDCDDAYYKLPSRVKYSFKGNVCTMIGLAGISEEEELGEYAFAANGAFPSGTYSQNGWGDSSKEFYQNRLTFKSDGTGILEYREAEDANGTGATAWEEETTFTYTYSGTQAAGGMFYITMNWDEDNVEPEPGVKSVRSASIARASHSIFKMIKR